MRAVNPENSRESAPLAGSSFSVFPGGPPVGRHSWDGSAKMPNDSYQCCKPQHMSMVEEEGRSLLPISAKQAQEE